MVHIKLNTTKLKETFFPNHNLFFIQNKIIKIKKTTTDDEQGIYYESYVCDGGLWTNVLSMLWTISGISGPSLVSLCLYFFSEVGRYIWPRFLYLLQMLTHKLSQTEYFLSVDITYYKIYKIDIWTESNEYCHIVFCVFEVFI